MAVSRTVGTSLEHHKSMRIEAWLNLFWEHIIGKLFAEFKILFSKNNILRLLTPGQWKYLSSAMGCTRKPF
jgi:hypothetical protein